MNPRVHRTTPTDGNRFRLIFTWIDQTKTKTTKKQTVGYHIGDFENFVKQKQKQKSTPKYKSIKKR